MQTSWKKEVIQWLHMIYYVSKQVVRKGKIDADYEVKEERKHM